MSSGPRDARTQMVVDAISAQPLMVPIVFLERPEPCGHRTGLTIALFPPRDRFAVPVLARASGFGPTIGIYAAPIPAFEGGLLGVQVCDAEHGQVRVQALTYRRDTDGRVDPESWWASEVQVLEGHPSLPVIDELCRITAEPLRDPGWQVGLFMRDLRRLMGLGPGWAATVAHLTTP